jgi:serine/threonine protein kinase
VEARPASGSRRVALTYDPGMTGTLVGPGGSPVSQRRGPLPLTVSTTLFATPTTFALAGLRETEWLGRLLEGKYRIESRLGSGQFGQVFVVTTTRQPVQRFVMKVMPNADVDDELAVLAAVAHPNVVQLVDRGHEDGHSWFVMPRYDGATLAELLDREPESLLNDDGLDLFIALARALDALHSSGIRHQDIKPDNVFLCASGGRMRHPLVIDFGVAAMAGSVRLGGTPEFYAPEQHLAFLRGSQLGPEITAYAAVNGAPSGPVGTACDVYALGVCLLRAFGGIDDAPGVPKPDTVSDSLADTLRGLAPWIQGLHGARRHLELPSNETESGKLLQGLIRRCLAIDPAARPTAASLADELTALRESAVAERAVAPVRASHRRTLVRSATIVGAVVAAMAVSGGTFATVRYADPLDSCTARVKELYELNAGGATTFEQCKVALTGAEERVREAKADLDSCDRSLVDAARGAGGAKVLEDRIANLTATCNAREKRLNDANTTITGERDAARATAVSEKLRADAEKSRADGEKTRADGEKRRADAEGARADGASQAVVAQAARADAAEQRVGAAQQEAQTQRARADAAEARAANCVPPGYGQPGGGAVPPGYGQPPPQHPGRQPL